MATITRGGITITYSITTTDTAVTCSVTNVTWDQDGSYNRYAADDSSNRIYNKLCYDYGISTVTVAQNYTTSTDPTVLRESRAAFVSNVKSAISNGGAKKTWTRGKTATTGNLHLSIQRFYEGTVTITVPAKPSYAINYNVNGGTSSAPAAQTKWYGETLTLTTTKPTRTDFAFTNWNTNSAGSGTSYASGASYTANAAATLYAQWRRIYSDPKASVVSVQRVDATTHDPDEYGTSVAVVVSWSLFNTPSGTNHPNSIVVACNGVTETLTGLTGLTGTATAYLDADCDPDQQYPVTATLTDDGGASRSAIAMGVVTTPYYPIDIRQGGRGVAIGGPSSEDAFDVFMPVKVLPRSTSASETPLTISDGTDDVLAVDWNGNVEYSGTLYGRTWRAGISGTTSGGTTTLPSNGTYLLVTGHNSTPALNGIWIVRTSNNIAFRLAGGGNVTVTVSGTNVNVTTTAGTANVYYQLCGA